MALLPAIVFAVLMGLTWHALTKPNVVTDTSQLEQMGGASTGLVDPSEGGDSASKARADRPGRAAVRRTPRTLPAAVAKSPVPVAAKPAAPAAKAPVEWQRIPAPTTYWYVLGVGTAALVFFYAIFTFVRFEIFKMLLASFFPLAVMILAVLGTIVFGLATPTEAAAVGSFGGFVLAAVYRCCSSPPSAAPASLRRGRRYCC